MLTMIPLWIALLAAPQAADTSSFETCFTGATLRLDYYHTGDAEHEFISLDRVRIEGPWPGSKTQLLDHTNLGKYRFEVLDLGSQRLLYSRGFASIYGEWETTGEARLRMRTLPEALRLPEPRKPFQVRLYKRGDDQVLRELWTSTIDPTSRFVDRSPLPVVELLAAAENGADTSLRVDLLVLGDGYTAAEGDKFRERFQLVIDSLFAVEPFRSRRQDFNFWALCPPAAESGVSRPRAGTFKANPLGASYNTFDSERYVLTYDDRAWRDLAATAPYDFVIFLINERKYGGGGIFQLYCTAAADSAFAPYLIVHEFGHSFAGLGDEYYTSPTSYEEFVAPSVEPWEPNITALLDPEDLKWRDLLTPGADLPTPWNHEEYGNFSRQSQARRGDLRQSGAAEEVLEKLFEEEREKVTAMLGIPGQKGVVGAFEGAMYQARGLYRPAVDCIMFTRDEVGFCPVCQRALKTIIDLYSVPRP
jgi:hypothetical protein